MIEELPRDVRTQRTLARWIWTLYRDRPGLTEGEVMTLTAADQGYVNRSVTALLSLGLLTGDGEHRRTRNTIRPVSQLKRHNRPDAPVPRSVQSHAEKQVFQVKAIAQSRCAVLTTPEEPYALFVVQAVISPEQRAAVPNRAAGTAYVVAREEREIPALMQAQARHAALFAFDHPDAAQRPRINRLTPP